MFASLLIAASMTGQAPNVARLWTGNGYVVAAFDTSKPLTFQGGSINLPMPWYPALDGYGGGFASLPFIIAGSTWPVTLQLIPRCGEDGDTWGLVESDGHRGDSMIAFDSASAGNASGTTSWRRMPLIASAGATSFTVTQ